MIIRIGVGSLTDVEPASTVVLSDDEFVNSAQYVDEPGMYGYVLLTQSVHGLRIAEIELAPSEVEKLRKWIATLPEDEFEEQEFVDDHAAQILAVDEWICDCGATSATGIHRPDCPEYPADTFAPDPDAGQGSNDMGETFEEAATKAGMVVGCLKCVARNQGTLEPKKHHKTCPNRRGGAKKPTGNIVTIENGVTTAVQVAKCSECGGIDGFHWIRCNQSAAAKTAEREITHGPGQSEDIDAEHHQEQSAISLEISELYAPESQQEATAQELNAVPPEKVDGFDF